MSMDLFIARTMTTKASLVFRGSIDITENQVYRSFSAYGFIRYLQLLETIVAYA